MPEGILKLPRKPPESVPSSDFVPSEVFVLAHHPARQVVIQVIPHGRHRQFVESTVILMPATDYRVEYGGQIRRALVTFQLKVPPTNGLSHCLQGVTTDSGGGITRAAIDCPRQVLRGRAHE
jgi:hypothetical protein